MELKCSWDMFTCLVSLNRAYATRQSVSVSESCPLPAQAIPHVMAMQGEALSSPCIAYTSLN